MGNYIPNTPAEQKEMLREIGFGSFDDLYRDIPESVRLREPLNIPEGKSELSVRRIIEGMAEKNTVYRHIFRGAGAYNHYIPAIVNTIAGREEFRTAYTPYQAEISQGVLQTIFEYQTDICTLTGLEAANASVYDGAVAAAEACEMCRERKRSTVLASGTVDPKILSVVKTYCFGRNVEVLTVPEKNGVTDQEELKKLLTPDVSCLLVQHPNYYGNLEPMEDLTNAVHAAGAKIIESCNPISLAVLKTPGELGVDVAVGEGQPLGIPLSYGGPYLGFMAAGKKMMRKLPGRIVGQTVDCDGNRTFVLTLQAREQHIRREKASSNICSNEALMALRAAAYLAAMGPGGLTSAAVQCSSKAHYLQEKLAEAGLAPYYPEAEFFHEFVTSCPDEEKVLSALSAQGILGGLPLGDGRILWCATEMNTKEEIDYAAAVVKEVTGA